MERELERAGIGFRKNDNAFLAVDDVTALQAAADRLSAKIIRQQLDYWTFLLGKRLVNGSSVGGGEGLIFERCRKPDERIGAS